MKKVDVGKDHAGEKWTDVMGWSEGEITIDEGELSSTHLNWGPS
jgi:alpha-amylase